MISSTSSAGESVHLSSSSLSTLLSSSFSLSTLSLKSLLPWSQNACIALLFSIRSEELEKMVSDTTTQPQDRRTSASNSLKPKFPAIDEEIAPIVAVGRLDVDPLCVNALNPFHRCGDYCTRKRLSENKPRKEGNQTEKKSSLSVSFTPAGGGKERLVTLEISNVKTTCQYAQKPGHQCTKFCSLRISETDENPATPETNTEGSVEVVKKKDVNPGMCIKFLPKIFCFYIVPMKSRKLCQ
ncbi:hypothetical protein HPP92_022729 [Vanilla planifolia]|uniref:Uncharacterized protein n=1 Tax=Vanilla planifolia TaxID=51239 RepID=A0A835PX34_VANPL|nr:hypothetical protein HPP92_022729 [Vanilla planifolia]